MAAVPLDPATDPGDIITLVRIDPARFELVVAGPGWSGESGPKTAREWAAGQTFTAVINAGMYATDFRSHVGYLESRGIVNSAGINAYKSVAAFDPRGMGSRPAFRIFDLDVPGTTVESIRRDYGSVVQNLRLIGRPGINQWRPKPQRWSEAALGEDRAGRILFIFCPVPVTMFDLNRRLLACGAEIVAAQHLEGGPQAQLYLRSGGTGLDLHGGGATGAAWPVPLVLGVRPRGEATGRP